MKQIVMALLLLSFWRTPVAWAGPNEDLRQGISQGNSAQVKQAIQQGANPNQVIRIGYQSWTVLSWASRWGHYQLAQFLLNHHANPNLDPDHGELPLVHAAMRGDQALLDLLLTHGATLTPTALTMAAHEGHLATVKYLVFKGADPNSKEPADGSTALMHAAYGHPEVVEFLLSKGADPNIQDREGHTALMAAQYGHHKEVQLLLAKGADPNLKDQQGWTALNLAIFRGQKEMVHLLVQKGADKDNSLLIATSYAPIELIEWLLDKGADIQDVDQSGGNALRYSSDPKIIQFLLNKGCNPNHQDQDGVTALMSAAYNNRLDIIQLLLQKGADAKLKDKHGKTALDYAKQNEHRQIIAYLESLK